MTGLASGPEQASARRWKPEQHRTRLHKHFLVLLGVVLVWSTFAVGAAGADAEPNSGDVLRCNVVNVAVALSAGLPRTERIQGQLCAAGSPAGRPIQILVHGYTLTRSYWDPQYEDGRYSYVKAAAARGYATLAIDRIGVGGSSKPPAAKITLASNVYALHEVVSAVRAGAVTGSMPTAVVLVGHSFGSAIAVTEAGRFRDVDAVVATSFLHQPGAGVAALVGSTEPVQLDPAFAGKTLPLGYVTTLPGTRGQFYAAGDTDPAIVALDEATKGTGTVGELATFGTYLLPISDALRVTVPVLLAVGSEDLYFCTLGLPCPSASVVVARERLYFGASAQLSGVVLPGAGHNMALELNAGVATSAILRWVADHGAAPRLSN